VNWLVSRSFITGTLISLCLGGCGLPLPAAGPTTSQLQASAAAEQYEYKLVNLDERVASILSHYNTPGLGERFRGPHYVASNMMRPGDTVSITIYESGGSSLFGSQLLPSGSGQPITTGAGVSTIPPQVIEADGTVFVPYVGRVKIGGQTPAIAGRLIAQGLQGKAVQPQVIVSVTNNLGSAATVGGDVNQPRPVPLTLRGERLLDVIAAAGGAKFPAYETYVQVARHGNVGTVLLERAIKDPSENIVVQPRDQIYLVHNPRTFAVLGASQKVSQYTFDTERVTLAEAIARAGGPIDLIADPSGIFLFRFEPYDVATKVLGDDNLGENGIHPSVVPILYKLALTNANGIFIAQSIQMRDKDVILITNSDAAQLQKFMAIVRSFTGVAFDLKRSTVIE
jgi:polysaccharide export outer membrane protein